MRSHGNSRRELYRISVLLCKEPAGRRSKDSADVYKRQPRVNRQSRLFRKTTRWKRLWVLVETQITIFLTAVLKPPRHGRGKYGREMRQGQLPR